MNATKKMTLLALGLLIAGVGFAQSQNNSSPGWLGYRYAELGFGLHDFTVGPDHTYSFGGDANLPIVPSLIDVNLGFAHDWTTGPRRGHTDVFSGMPIAYTALDNVKPFAGIGMAWQTTGLGSEAHGLWGAVAGIEFGSPQVTITPRVTYVDDFQVTNVSNQQWSWSVETSLWVVPRSGLVASVGRTSVRSSPVHSWDYRLGWRMKF